MRMCQHCGAGVPNYAGFCGECGQLVNIAKPPVQEVTVWISHSSSPPDQPQTTIPDESKHAELAQEDEETRKDPQADLDDMETHEDPLVDLHDMETRKNPVVNHDDTDKDERQYSKMIDFNLPLLTDAVAEQPTAHVPIVQSMPQIASAPTLVEVSSITNRQPPSGGNITTVPAILPDPARVFTSSSTHGLQHLQKSGNPSHVLNKPQSKQPSGCMVWLLAAIIVPLLILSGIIGIGFTILAPTLTLDGNTSVATGDILHLHGGHFIPGNSVTCMLDGNIPLSYSSLSSPASDVDTLADTLVTAQQKSKTTGTDASATITVGSDGTFSVTFVVGQDWKVGLHTIRAAEAFSPRNATTTFSVTGNGQTVNTATSTATATAKKTATRTPSATPATKPGLSAVTPNIITFGPISEGYTQVTSTQILLNTAGTDVLSWTASWNTAQAPWLQLSAHAGQVQEPNTQTLIASAIIGNLKAGTYTTTILFRSNGQKQQSFSLPISLIIQAGCVKTVPTTLNFTGTIGANNPATQIITLNNCGALGSWTEATTGGSWLLVSPTGGNLNNQASQSILVSATPAKVKSGAGTYHGQITFTNGPARAIVNVIFTVKAPSQSTLGINTTSVSIHRQCKFRQNMWQCFLITLNSNKAATSNLNWTATSNGAITLTVKPANGTLQPGQTAAIEIDAPHLTCNNLAPVGKVIFSGPVNSVTVNVNC